MNLGARCWRSWAVSFLLARRRPKEGGHRVSNDKICIYCRQTDPDRFRGVEHVIPQGFGRFGSETPTLDCVCDDCNCLFRPRIRPAPDPRHIRGHLPLQPRPAVQRSAPTEAAKSDACRSGRGGRFCRPPICGRWNDRAAHAVMPPGGQFHVHNFRTGKDEVYFPRQIAGLTLPAGSRLRKAGHEQREGNMEVQDPRTVLGGAR